jgi:hypothetical protein
LPAIAEVLSQFNSTKEIRLAHYSVQEFFISDRLTSECVIYKITKKPASMSIAKTCLSYLTGVFEWNLKVIPQELPLAEYAAEYWIRHAKAAEGTYIDDMDYRIARFLECELTRNNWVQLFNPEDAFAFFDILTEVSSPLYYASWAGLQGSVKALLDNGSDVNWKGGLCDNALQVASVAMKSAEGSYCQL